MKFDLVKPSRPLITILTYLGLWRVNNKWMSFYKVYTYALHIIFTFLTAASLWASVFIAKGVDEITKSLFMSLIETALMGKVLNLLTLNKEVSEFFHIIQGDEFLLRTSKEITFFETCHRGFSTVQKLYIGASMMAAVLSFVVTGIDSNRELPYPAWMPFNTNGRQFWFAFIYQLFGLLFTCLSNITIDMLQCYGFYHISVLYRVIAFRLESLGCDTRCSNIDKSIFEEMSEIIRLHQTVLRITRNSERFTSVPILIQILLSALILCFAGYRIQNTSPFDNPGTFLQYLNLLLVMNLQIFLPCYYANEVAVQSEKLSYALFSSNWVDMPPESRRMIYLQLEFLKKPVHVKAGKFFTIGLLIFSKTINNAYTFFAILINMND